MQVSPKVTQVSPKSHSPVRTMGIPVRLACSYNLMLGITEVWAFDEYMLMSNSCWQVVHLEGYAHGTACWFLVIACLLQVLFFLFEVHVLHPAQLWILVILMNWLLDLLSTLHEWVPSSLWSSMDFLFIIRRTLWHIPTQKWPIGHCAANFWISPMSHQSLRSLKWMQFKWNFFGTLWIRG